MHASKCNLGWWWLEKVQWLKTCTACKDLFNIFNYANVCVGCVYQCSACRGQEGANSLEPELQISVKCLMSAGNQSLQEWYAQLNHLFVPGFSCIRYEDYTQVLMLTHRALYWPSYHFSLLFYYFHVSLTHYGLANFSCSFRRSSPVIENFWFLWIECQVLIYARKYSTTELYYQLFNFGTGVGVFYWGRGWGWGWYPYWP